MPAICGIGRQKRRPTTRASRLPTCTCTVPANMAAALSGNSSVRFKVNLRLMEGDLTDSCTLASTIVAIVKVKQESCYAQITTATFQFRAGSEEDCRVHLRGVHVCSVCHP